MAPTRPTTRAQRGTVLALCAALALILLVCSSLPSSMLLTASASSDVGDVDVDEHGLDFDDLPLEPHVHHEPTDEHDDEKAALKRNVLAKLRRRTGGQIPESLMQGLQDFYTENSIELIKANIRYSPETDFGLYATADIDQGDEIVRAPVTLTIASQYLEDSPLTEEMQRLFGDQQPDELTAIALHILHEKVHKSQSFYSRWIHIGAHNCSMISNEELNSTVMWDFNEVNELQISEEFVAMMQSLVDHMQEQYHRYFEPVSKLSIMDGIIVKPEVFQWAYLTAIARGVPMKSKTGDVSYGIVPGIDWVNHAYDNNAHLDFSMQGRMLGSMTLRATRDIAAGEQIVRNYVPMPNNQLLLRFGFAIRDNPHDFVSVFLDQAVGATQMAARRKAILRRHQLDADFTEFSLLDTKKKYFHPDLLAAVRVVLANPQELRRIEQYQEKHGKLVCKTSKLSMRNEIDVLEFLGEKIIAARSYQWTTLEEDIATLDRSGSSLAPRLRHALIFRIGQKEIYARALEIILEQRHDLLIKYNEYKKNKKPSADDGAALDSDSDSSSPAVDERKPVENDSPAAATARLIDELQQKKKAAKKAKSKPAGDRTEL